MCCSKRYQIWASFIASNDLKFRLNDLKFGSPAELSILTPLVQSESNLEEVEIWGFLKNGPFGWAKTSIFGWSTKVNSFKMSSNLISVPHFQCTIYFCNHNQIWVKFNFNKILRKWQVQNNSTGSRSGKELQPSLLYDMFRFQYYNTCSSNTSGALQLQAPVFPAPLLASCRVSSAPRENQGEDAWRWQGPDSRVIFSTSSSSMSVRKELKRNRLQGAAAPLQRKELAHFVEHLTGTLLV